MVTVNTLVYKHFAYQENILEGITDPVLIKSAYDKWSNWCIITTISSKHIRIELPPDKTNLSVHHISHYKDYKVLNGLWIAIADYNTDIEEFYLCRNWVQALIRKWILRVRCKGPYLIHMIDLR